MVPDQKISRVNSSKRLHCETTQTIFEKKLPTFYIPKVSIIVTPFWLLIFRMSVILSHQLNRLRYLARPQLTQIRQKSNLFSRGGNVKPQNQSDQKFRQASFLNYLCAIGISFLGLGFWSVPLYRVFCESVGLGNNLRGNTVSNRLKTWSEVCSRGMRPIK